MRVDKETGLGHGRPEDVYVYEAPVRVWHWFMVFCVVILAPTGFLIGAPLHSFWGEATGLFFVGWIRMIHVVVGLLLIATFVLRLYWGVVGNRFARQLFYIPFWNGNWWSGLFRQAGYYLFVRDDTEHWVGHNPLAQAAMFGMFLTSFVVLIVTGLGLYAQPYGWGSAWMNAFGWVTTLLGTPQAVRTVHHVAMYVLLLFAGVHFYMVIREDVMGGETVFGVMGSGIRMFKRNPHPGN